MLRPRAQLRDLGSMTGRICEKGKKKNQLLPYPGKLLGRRIEGRVGRWDTTGGKIVPGEGEVQRVEAAGWQLAFVGAEIQNGQCVLYLFWLLALATSPRAHFGTSRLAPVNRRWRQPCTEHGGTGTCDWGCGSCRKVSTLSPRDMCPLTAELPNLQRPCVNGAGCFPTAQVNTPRRHR